MQLDFTQFLSKFEKISSLKPVPHKEYVENYVKAYYLPETELEKWIREHKVSPFAIFFLNQKRIVFNLGIFIEAPVRVGQLRLPEQQENQTETAAGDRGYGKEPIWQIAGRTEPVAKCLLIKKRNLYHYVILFRHV